MIRNSWPKDWATDQQFLSSRISKRHTALHPKINIVLFAFQSVLTPTSWYSQDHAGRLLGQVLSSRLCLLLATRPWGKLCTVSVPRLPHRKKGRDKAPTSWSYGVRIKWVTRCEPFRTTGNAWWTLSIPITITAVISWVPARNCFRRKLSFLIIRRSFPFHCKSIPRAQQLCSFHCYLFFLYSFLHAWPHPSFADCSFVVFCLLLFSYLLLD